MIIVKLFSLALLITLIILGVPIIVVLIGEIISDVKALKQLGIELNELDNEIEKNNKKVEAVNYIMANLNTIYSTILTTDNAEVEKALRERTDIDGEFKEAVLEVWHDVMDKEEEYKK